MRIRLRSSKSTRLRRARRGTTLPELLISLMITAFLAAGLGSILYAASYGTSSRREIRRVVVRVEQVRNRMDDAIRNARAVLSAGTSSGTVYVLLWMADTTGDNQVNISEMQLIELASGSTTLRSYTAATTPSPNTAYPAGSNYYSAATAAKTGGALTGTVWSQGVSNWTVTLDQAATGTKLVTWKLTLTSDPASEDVVGASALRTPIAPQ
jgi:type II secretory pathway pseudopilin PulG